MEKEFENIPIIGQFQEIPGQARDDSGEVVFITTSLQVQVFKRLLKRLVAKGTTKDSKRMINLNEIVNRTSSIVNSFAP